MADEHQNQAAADASAQAQNGPDPKFFDCVNEYLELANKQSQQYGEKRISLASMYAAARFLGRPLLERFGATSTCRASFALYNTREEIDALADALGRAESLFS